MKTSHIPTRKCVVCMQQKPKSELLRLVKTENGNIVIDQHKKICGRGVYVDIHGDCVSQLKKRKSLEKKFRCAVPQEVFDQIEGFLNEQ